MCIKHLQVVITTILLSLSVQSRAQPIEPVFNSTFDAYRDIYLDRPDFTNLGPCVEYKRSRYAKEKNKS